MLGEDMFGDFLLDSLRAAGAGVRYVRRTAAAKTALAFVSLDADGERSFSFYRPPAADLLRKAVNGLAVFLASDASDYMNGEMIAVGAMSPLEGFLGKADYDSVVERCRLASGAVWSLPITLRVHEDVAGSFLPAVAASPLSIRPLAPAPMSSALLLMSPKPRLASMS